MKAASFYNCPYFPSQSLVFTFIKKMFNFSIHPNSKYQLASLVLTKKIQCLVQKQKKLTSHFPFPAVQVIVIKMYILDKEDILNSTYNQLAECSAITKKPKHGRVLHFICESGCLANIS